MFAVPSIEMKPGARLSAIIGSDAAIGKMISAAIAGATVLVYPVHAHLAKGNRAAPTGRVWAAILAVRLNASLVAH